MCQIIHRSQNRTVLKACHRTTNDICTYLCKSTILSKSAVITLILKLSNSYYNKILIMRLICGTKQSLLSTNSAISDSGSQSQLPFMTGSIKIVK